ncbi:MAG: system, fructose subfamily, subunit, partial [Mycobacterium sp.]|nr:system, fructose subfamily, subunit [Mycobacterium sp.]
IPFAAADPLRVIPPVMIGGAVTGAIIMGAGVELSAPHGGIFVAFAINGVLGFLVALVAGTLVGGAAVMAAKQIGRTPAAAAV